VSTVVSADEELQRQVLRRADSVTASGDRGRIVLAPVDEEDGLSVAQKGPEEKQQQKQMLQQQPPHLSAPPLPPIR